MPTISINFKDGFRTHKEQKLRLGEVVMDEHGDRWSYVKAAAAITSGRVVRDSVHTELLGNSGVGTVTAAGKQGSFLLKDSGEFANKEYLRGGIGTFTAGGAAGSAFYVREVIDDDTLRIESLGDDGDFDHRGGLHAATTTSTTYGLYVPGYVRQTSNSNRTFIRGVAQVAFAANDYGYVKQSGLAWVKATSGSTIVDGTEVFTVDAGEISVLTANSNSNLANIRFKIGVGLGNGQAASPSLVQLDIVNNIRSFAYPDDRLAFNYTDVKGRQ